MVNKREVSSYLEGLFDKKQYNATSALLIKTLRPLSKTFKAIAFCGMSGAMIVPQVAHKLGKELILVRKSESSHSTHKVEGCILSPFIIIDDFVLTGDTIHRILREVALKAPAAVCKAVYGYAGTANSIKEVTTFIGDKKIKTPVIYV